MNIKNFNDLSSVHKAHFIGIGGSGMFPLAQILHSMKIEVTGSDNYQSDTLDKVEKLGIKVFKSHDESNITDQDIVVYSAAIKEENPEIQAAIKKNIPIIKRCELMGMIFEKYNVSIGVSGTHGKTTTTSMITSVLIDAKKSPTAIIGGTLLKVNSNCVVGNSDIVVGEACEYMDSFLSLSPSISVITNVDKDHLDYFGTFENVKKSFEKYANKTTDLIVLNGDDINTRECVKNIDKKKLFFGLSEKNDIYASNISFKTLQRPHFSIFKGNQKLTELTLKVPGEHNIYNALAAFCVCYHLGVDVNTIKTALEDFKGTHRRFELIKEKNNITVADDFAHHPTEIKAILQSAMKMNFERVWTIFQPHTYSRTYMLLDDFVNALSISDKVIISDILPVRETNIYGVKSTDITNKIPQSIYIPTFEEITEFIIKNAKPGDLILTLGGGNVYKCAEMIAQKL